jgi:type VI secretion system protein VasJ
MASKLRDMERRASSVSDKADLILSVDQTSLNDQFAQVSLWHYLLKNHLRAAPNAIFMGGTLNRIYLAIFRRPLTTADFVQLWSLSSAG